MKSVFTSDVRPVQILSNGASRGDAWAKIVDARTKKVLHTGQLRYIRRLAKKRYHKVAEL